MGLSEFTRVCVCVCVHVLLFVFAQERQVVDAFGFPFSLCLDLLVVVLLVLIVVVVVAVRPWSLFVVKSTTIRDFFFSCEVRLEFSSFVGDAMMTRRC